MMLLVFSLLAFAVVHLVPAIPRARNAATLKLGRAYGPVYGVASLLLFVATLVAFRGADVAQIYEPPHWGRIANFGLTLIGFLFLGIFLFRGSWRLRIGYPMAWATVFWSGGHLLANGEGRSLVFFAGFALIALMQAFLHSRLVGKSAADVRVGHNALSLLAGLALYGLAAQLHGVIAGVPVIDISSLAR
jgi:uncharacterized membrane protein